MKHLSLTLRSIFGLVALSTLPATSFAQTATYVNPSSLVTTAITNPSNVASSAQNTLTTGLQTTQNAALSGSGLSGADTRAIGSIGTSNLGTKVQTAATSDAASAAKSALQSAGVNGYNSSAIASAISNPSGIGTRLQDTLTTDAQTYLNSATNGFSIPGLGDSSPTPSTFVQKNEYVAATDDATVYYGGSNATGANPNTSAVASVVATVVQAATSSASTGSSSTGSTASTAVHALAGSNQIVNASGVVVANYNTTTGQFTSTSGSVVSPDSNDYATYKAALTSAGTNTAALNSPGSTLLP